MTPTALATAPAAPAIGTATPLNVSALVRWTPPVNGGSAITGYEVRVVNAVNGQVGLFRTATAGANSLTVNGLTNGTAYRFQVRATNTVGTSAYSALSVAVTPRTVPGTPVIGTATSGTAGGVVNATARWGAPASNGGSAITGYRVTAERFSASGVLLSTNVSAVQAATSRSFTMTLNAGIYRFRVQAINAAGTSAVSTRSNLVTAR